MSWLTLRFGLLNRMGGHCPARRLRRLALLAALAAVSLGAACIAARSASASAAASLALRAQWEQARADREALLAFLNGAPLVEALPGGASNYLHARIEANRIGPVIVGLNDDGQ